MSRTFSTHSGVNISVISTIFMGFGAATDTPSSPLITIKHRINDEGINSTSHKSMINHSLFVADKTATTQK